MRTTSACLYVLLLAGCAARDAGRAVEPASAVAVQGASPALATQLERVASGRELVCRRETPIGSLIERRVCRTPEQWQRIRQRSEQMVADLRRRH